MQLGTHASVPAGRATGVLAAGCLSPLAASEFEAVRFGFLVVISSALATPSSGRGAAHAAARPIMPKHMSMLRSPQHLRDSRMDPLWGAVAESSPQRREGAPSV